MFEDPQPDDVTFERCKPILLLTAIKKVPRMNVGELIKVKGKLRFSNKVRVIDNYGRQVLLIITLVTKPEENGKIGLVHLNVV